MKRPRHHTRGGFSARAALLAAAAILLGSAVGSLVRVYATTINVPSGTILMNKAHSLAMGELVPSQCSGLGISNIQRWNATNAQGGASAGSWITIWGSGTNSVWLWNEKNQTTGSGGANMKGAGGNDCMVPGGTRSTALTVGGGAGTDQCYTGPGSGTYTRNSCNNNPLWGTPYQSVTTNNPTFS
jgi:hypothetical protein